MPAHDNGYVVISARGAGGAAAYAEFLYVPPRLDEIPAGSITTVAGIGSYGRLFGPATSAALNPEGLAFDGNNNLYATQTNPGNVAIIRPDGSIEKIAGTGDVLSPIGDNGPATDASISFPRSIALDSAGNAYVPDVHYRIRRIDAVTRIITTIAGTGTKGYSGDGGAATSAQIGEPTFIATDGDSVYFIDFNAMRVRRIRNGQITTYAGNGIAGFSGDNGPATLASFDVGVEDNGGLALDSGGNLYLADSRNRRIRRIDHATNIITTFIDASVQNSAWFSDHFENIAIDRNDHLYYGGNGTIREFDAGGHYLRSWQGKVQGTTIDGALADAFIGDVVGIAVDATGRIAFSDAVLQRIRRIDPATQTVQTIAGIGPGILGENGPAIASLCYPRDLAWSLAGELLVADSCCGQESRLRKLDAHGNLITIAGGGLLTDDFTPRPALQDFLDSVVSVIPDSAGNIDFVSWSAGVVRRLDAQGNVRQIAGKRTRCGYTGDGGPATAAQLCQPWAARRDRAGNLFIADTNNNRIRRVDGQTGVITTVVGNGGPVGAFERYNSGSFCGDGGPAFDACINTPYGVAFDPDGNLYVSEGQRVRRVDANGTITTFLPGGAINAMVFDRGFLYSAQFTELHRFDAAGGKTVLAGTGTPGFSGDGGAAKDAKVAISLQGAGIAIDSDGDIFFGDGNRIRVIRQGALLSPPHATITATANAGSIVATVLDGDGNRAPSVRVDFTAPSSGPSCTLSSPFAITDANGVAGVTCNSDCVGGSYSVTARPLAGTSSATVSLTNADGPCRRRAVRH